jgi:hypothetical protein
MRVGLPETKRNHAPAPALRHRQTNQIAHEIDLRSQSNPIRSMA